jgi:hypothetical protein
MQIQHSLPQFDTRKTLLIISGKQEAKLYVAHKGVIQLWKEFQVPTPHYSDREGFFMTRGRGAVMQAGAIYEAKEQVIFTNFYHELNTQLKEFFAKQSAEDIVLCAPEYCLQNIQSHLPVSTRKKIIATLPGNYLKQHPFDILKRVQHEIVLV